jgi:cation diffusion facilitator CzcD-associated flavoprotein CzcO
MHYAKMLTCRYFIHSARRPSKTEVLMDAHQVVIVGAGPSGVATAVSLRDRGVHPLLLDRADKVGASWLGRYERLKLNTHRDYSHLPGRPFPPGTPILPTRADVVEHLDRHAHEDGIAVQLDTEVHRIDRESGGWRLQTSRGIVDAPHVVVATGYEHTPVIPDWPGKAGFTGEIVHSAHYRNPTPYLGKRVLVVGGGSSGFEIVTDLATGGAAKAWLSLRTPPNILPLWNTGGVMTDFITRLAGRTPLRLSDQISRLARRINFGDLTEFGLPIPAEGPFARAARIGKAPAIVDRDVIESIRNRSVEVVAEIEAFDAGIVCLRSGVRIQPDVVIAATGFRRGLKPLVGHLGVLDGHDVPCAEGETAAAEGLWFIGFFCRPMLIGMVADQSKYLADRIAAELRHKEHLDLTTESTMPRPFSGHQPGRAPHHSPTRY